MLFDLFYRNLHRWQHHKCGNQTGTRLCICPLGPKTQPIPMVFFPWDPCCQNIDILKLYSSKIHNKLCNKKLARVEIQLDKLFKTRPKRIEWVATHVFSVALPSPSLRHWFKCWRRWLKRPTAPGLSPRCVSLEPVSCIGMIRLDNIRA